MLRKHQEKKGYKILSNAKIIYKIHSSNGTCELVDKDKERVLNMWKNGGFQVEENSIPGPKHKGFFYPFEFFTIDLGGKEGHGKYLYTFGGPIFSMYIANNKQLCTEIALNHVEKLKKLIKNNVKSKKVLFN